MDVIITAVSVVLVGLLSMIGNMYGARKAANKTDALVSYKVEQLAQHVAKHNEVVERTYKLEEWKAVACEQHKVINHRLDDLEEG